MNYAWQELFEIYLQISTITSYSSNKNYSWKKVMELLRSNQLNRGVVHRFASAMRFILAEGCKTFKKLSRLTLEYLNSSYSISNCENHQLLFFAKISFGHKNMPFQVMLPMLVIHNRIKYSLKWHFCSHKLGFSRNFPSMFILL